MYSLREFGIRCSTASLWDSWPPLLPQSAQLVSPENTYAHARTTHSHFLSFHFFLNYVLLYIWNRVVGIL